MVDGTLVLFGTVVFGVLCENFLWVGGFRLLLYSGFCHAVVVTMAGLFWPFGSVVS
jgi:hypothetical protein